MIPVWRRILWWIADRPLVFRIWLCDRIAGPTTDEEIDKQTIREDMGQFAP